MFDDLREFIEAADDLGQVRVIEGADYDLEIGAITELSQSRADQPLLLFDRIKGYPPGFRTATNVLNNYKLIALAYGLPLESRGLDLVKGWRDRAREDFTRMPAVQVKSGPVEENVMMGNDVDLWRFPSPKWHEHDGGRYIGTGDVVITRDPETGYLNLGTFRTQVHDRNTVTIFVDRVRYTRRIMEKYWSKGQSCPVAVVCGCDPRIMVIAGSTVAPVDGGRLNEYDYAGWLRKKPVEVITGKTVDLPVPARAEIVLEGQVSPPGVDDRVEGPYGEGKGYYDGGFPEPAMRVTCVMHRNEPIILGCPPLCGEYELRYGMFIPKAAVMWDELERHVSGIKGVWLMQQAREPIAVISMEQQYVGHAKEAAFNAAGCYTRVSPYMASHFIIVVDDDIDPSSLTEVMFAIGTRCNPENAVDVIGGMRSHPMEPILSPEKRRSGDTSIGKCFIYACKPFPWMNQFPRTNRCSTGLLEQVRTKWGRHLFQ